MADEGAGVPSPPAVGLAGTAGMGVPAFGSASKPSPCRSPTALTGPRAPLGFGTSPTSTEEEASGLPLGPSGAPSGGAGTKKGAGPASEGGAAGGALVPPSNARCAALRAGTVVEGFPVACPTHVLGAV
jgi:hypothetical protein